MRAARRRWGTAALVAVALLAALVAGGAGAGAAPRPDAGGQTDVPLSGACPGGLSIVAVPESGPPMCTHGPDPGVTPTDLAAQGGGRTEASAGIQCYGNGTSGPRVQLLYAYSGTNRLASLRDRMARRAAEVDAIFDASARQTGGERHVRWLTDANCDLDIRAVRVTSTAVPVTAFSSLLIPQLKSAGYTSSSRKYLVWVDTGTSITVGGNVACSGIGTLYADEEPDPERNYNNTQGGYTRVDDKCLFPVFDPVGGKVEAHELTHTLGAVQGRLVLANGTVWTNGSPHHTAYGHCTDDYDIMCYVDGPGTSVSRVCTNVSNEMRLDCNHDDYFSTAPPSGSYLDRNWNTADSRFLEDVPGTPQPPGPPQSVVATPGDHQVTLSWTKPTSDGGGPVLGYRVYRDGQPLPPVTTAPTTDGSDLVAGTSYTDTDAVNGVPHGYQVTAVNEIGESARSAVVSALAGVPRPDVQLATSRTGPFSFGDVFATSMTGNPQVLTRRAARGTAVTTFVRIENDRPGVDSFKVKGVGSGNGYTVRYLRGTTDVTAAVVAGTYTVTDVPAGGHVDLKMKVTIGTNAPRGSTRALTVTVKSKTVKTIKDVAQVRVKRA